jgi:hypothetical protein
MKPSHLKTPKQQPWGMLDGFGLQHTLENEQFLCWILVQCQEAGEWIVVKTPQSHPDLVEKGILEEVGDPFHYRLTTKAKGLLYIQYGKENDNKEES